MRTLREQIEIDNAAVFGDKVGGFADDLTQYPGGVVEDAETVVGTFIEDEATRRNEAGDNTLRRGSLWIDATVPVTVLDQWLIDGETWGVDTFDQEAVGMRIVKLKRAEKRGTKTAPMTLR